MLNIPVNINPLLQVSALTLPGVSLHDGPGVIEVLLSCSTDGNAFRLLFLFENVEFLRCLLRFLRLLLLAEVFFLVQG